MKVKKVCANCGSDNVVTDAWVSWDIDSQQWVIDDIFDNDYCKSCEGETTIQDEEIEDENNIPNDEF